MRKSIFLILSLILLLGSCSSENIPDDVESENKINIVTSFYPLYEIAVRIGAENVNVTNIVPAGTEPHDYDPSPGDLVVMNEADLVIYNGAGLESWVEKIIPDLEEAGLKSFNASSLFANSIDPHFWLDPLKYIEEIKAISEKIVEIDPANADLYEKNSENFVAEIQALDNFYSSSLNSCKYNSFVTNHAAFAYLASRYNLEMISISGISPESEPSPKTMAELSDLVKSKGIKYILTESLVSPKISETIAQEVGAETLILNPLEGLTDEEIREGKDYVSVMEENLGSLRVALECK